MRGLYFVSCGVLFARRLGGGLLGRSGVLVQDGL